MKVKRESEVAQSCPTPSNSMDCSLPGSSVHGIFQARVLEWGAIAFSALIQYMIQEKKKKQTHILWRRWIDLHSVSVTLGGKIREKVKGIFLAVYET